MVETKETFSVNKNKDGSIKFTHLIVKTLTPQEALLQAQNIETEIVNNVNKECELRKQIDNKVLEKDFDRCSKKVYDLRKLGENMSKLLSGVQTVERHK